ncbi:hypothetical protein KL920_005286 [Ogataea angusta]|nr:hypothetical protein KL920_005286 [Ogataea angusta]
MVLQRWEKTEPFYSPSKIDIGECGSLNAAGNEQVLGLVELERQAKCWHPKDAFAGSIEKRQTHLPMHDFFSLSSCISVPFPQTLASRDPNQSNDLRPAQKRKHPRFLAVCNTSSSLGALASPQSGLHQPV